MYCPNGKARKGLNAKGGKRTHATAYKGSVAMRCAPREKSSASKPAPRLETLRRSARCARRRAGPAPCSSPAEPTCSPPSPIRVRG